MGKNEEFAGFVTDDDFKVRLASEIRAGRRHRVR